MSKNRFVNDTVKKIELEGGDWIKIKQELSFEEYQIIMKSADLSKMKELKEEAEDKTIDFSHFDIAIPLLKAALKDWSFADKEGKKIECTHENIDKLTPRTVLELLEPVSELIHIDEKEEKKSSQSSKPISQEDTKEKVQKTN